MSERLALLGTTSVGAAGILGRQAPANVMAIGTDMKATMEDAPSNCLVSAIKVWQSHEGPSDLPRGMVGARCLIKTVTRRLGLGEPGGSGSGGG